MKIFRSLITTLFFALFMLSGIIACAQNLHGKYYLEGSGDSGPRHLTFSKGKFADTLYGHVQNGYGRGNYHLSRRKLVLNYEVIPNQDSSIYSMKSNVINSKEGKLSTKLFIEGEPVQGIILFRDKDYQIIKRINTNTEGLVNLTIINDPDVTTVQIIGAFFYGVDIPKARLLGRATEGEVHFKDAAKSYIRPGRVIYDIKKNRGDKLILQSDNNREFVFSRAISTK